MARRGLGVSLRTGMGDGEPETKTTGIASATGAPGDISMSRSVTSR